MLYLGQRGKVDLLWQGFLFFFFNCFFFSLNFILFYQMFIVCFNVLFNFTTVFFSAVALAIFNI